MSTPADGDGLAIHRVQSSVGAERAVTLIGERLAAGAPPTDVAVLARVNSALLPVQVALTQAGIPRRAAVDAAALGRTGIRTALAYLRLGLDLERIERDDVFDTINRPARKVKSAVQPLLSRRGRFSIGQLEQLLDQLDRVHQDRFGEYLADLRALEAAITDGADTARCLAIIRHRIGLGEAMDALDSSRSRPEGSSHGDDLDALEQLAALQPDPAAFRSWLTDTLRVPSDPDGVTLSTVHRVKGMEWPHVVVVAANQGLFPHRLADDIEEERRVFHVAITRCQRHVDVVADRDRTSPFVAELHAPPARARARSRTGGDVELAPASRPAAIDPDRAEVVAARGVRLSVAGGLTGTVTEVASDHVVVDLGDAVTTRVAAGGRVAIDGVWLTLRVRPRPTSGGRTAGSQAAGTGTGGGERLLDVAEDEIDEALFEALRSWRARTASESGVPAYLIFHDRALRVIAARKPDTLRALGGCPGVGPAKLERFGDDVLDLVAAHP